MQSIKKNFVYSAILTGANYIFPLLIFPYVSRVLGVDKIGICNFVDSIVHYFMIFSMLGINVVGVREIAKSKNDRNTLNKCFSSIFILNTIFTIIAIIVYILCVLYIPKLHNYSDLMWVGAVELAFNLITIEWLFKGLEEFKFITSRTLLIKILFIISVFALIKEPSDYKLYFVLCALSLGVNALVNCVYARNYVHLKFRSLPLNVFCGAIVILGVYSILTNMYTTFNITFLGFASNDTEVGFYSTAQKVFVITLSIFTALTGVMLPRMSSLIGQNKIEEYKSLLGKTANLLFSFSFPLMLFIFFFAKDIINIISGTGYEGAVVPLKIMAPLLFVLGYEQILVIQGLMPLKKDRSILVNSVIGATVGLTLNFLIVPRLESTGTAIVWVLSEMSVLIIAQFYMQKYMGICFPYKQFLLNVLFVVPLSLLDWVISYLPFNSFVHILSAIAITSIYVLALHLCFLKNSVVNIMLNQLFDKLIIRK